MMNGHYRVLVPQQNSRPDLAYHAFAMDFISVSRCMLTEGQAMYLMVDGSTYKLIRSIYPRFRVYDKLDCYDTHHKLLLEKEEFVVQFECYYILNDSSEDVVDMGVRLFFPVSLEKNGLLLPYDDNAGNQLILYASLYREGLMNVRPTPLAQDSCPLHQNFMLCQEDDCDSGDDEIEPEKGVSAVWV